METTTTNQTSAEGSQFIHQIPLPNSSAVLVLGILSIAMCWCFGIVGITLGIIALVMAKNSNKLFISEPGKYTVSSYNNMNSGKICAIIGTALSGLWIVSFIIRIIFLGAAFGALFSGLPYLHNIFH